MNREHRSVQDGNQGRFIVHHKYVFVIGPPGCGKTSTCKIMQDMDKYAHTLHLSVGDFLRASSSRPGNQAIKAALKSNGLIDGPMLQSLIRQEVSKSGQRVCVLPTEPKFGPISSCMLLDGFPRAVLQWESPLEHRPILPDPIGVLVFKGDKNGIKARYLGRQDASRPGENEAVFETRWAQYMEALPGLLRMFADKEWSVKEVDVTSPDIRQRELALDLVQICKEWFEDTH